MPSGGVMLAAAALAGLFFGGKAVVVQTKKHVVAPIYHHVVQPVAHVFHKKPKV